MSISVVFNGVTYTIPEVGEEDWGPNVTSFLSAIPQGALQKSGGAFTLSANVNFGPSYGLLAAYFATRAANPASAGLFRLSLADTLGWRNNANSANLLLGVNGSDQLTFNGTAIIGAGISALTGDVTATGPGSAVATISANAVTNAKFRQSAALSLVGNATNAPANVADITASVDGQVLVRSGTTLAFALIANANISGTAAIAYSKLALTGSVVNADINASAAIAYSKLTLTGSVVNADINASAAIAYSKLTLTGSIVNADVNASAAIALTKLAALTNHSRALVSDSSGLITESAVTATELSYVAGVTSAIQTQINGKQASGNYITALTGDGTASGGGSAAFTLATVNGNVGSFGSSTSIPSFTVNAKGLITAASGNAVIAPAGTLTGTTLASNVVTSSLTSLGTIGTGTWQGSVIVATYGGTGVSSVTTSPTASSFSGWDASSNLSANNHVSNYRTTVTAAGTTTLVVGDAYNQYFTGSTTQIITLPDATTLPRTGFCFRIVNLSSGALTVNDKGGTLVQTLSTNSSAIITAKSISSSNGSWDSQVSVNNAGGGTVTSVTFTGDGTVLSATPSSAVTSSGTIAASLATQTARTFLSGPLSGSAAAPTFKALTVPTVQKFTSGSGTYTTPTSPAPLYIRVKMVGGGGGGGSSGSGGGSGGSNGGNTTFGSSFLTANGGTLGGTNVSGGAGGTATISAGTGIAVSGGAGGGGANLSAASQIVVGGVGGSSFFGGAGAGTGGGATAGGAAATNSGSGGGGGAYNVSGGFTGSGGGSGGYVEFVITSPSATYAYAVGSAGTGMTANTGTGNGGAGAAGVIIVEEFYS